MRRNPKSAHLNGKMVELFQLILASFHITVDNVSQVEQYVCDVCDRNLEAQALVVKH